jgi:hypothetical protein
MPVLMFISFKGFLWSFLAPETAGIAIGGERR